MSDSTPSISAVYSDLVLRHNRAPVGFVVLPEASHRGAAENRSCGDQIDVALLLGSDDQIGQATFQGDSCAICTAAASILCGLLPGQSRAAALRLLDEADHAIQHGNTDAPDLLGDLAAFIELKAAPARRKCALLPVSAFRQALSQD